MKKYSKGSKETLRTRGTGKGRKSGLIPHPTDEKIKTGRRKPDPAVNTLGEAESAYASNNFLFNPDEVPLSGLSSFQKMKMSEEGVAKKELEKLKDRFGLSYEQLAGLLLVTKATLINKPRSSRFNPAISEKIISIWEIYAYGQAVFADESLFREWLFRKNQALDGKIPFNFLHSSFGREEIRNLMGRIEYGVYS